MPVPLRRFYAQKLIEAKNKEAEQIKSATQNRSDKPNSRFKKS